MGKRRGGSIMDSIQNITKQAKEGVKSMLPSSQPESISDPVYQPPTISDSVDKPLTTVDQPPVNQPPLNISNSATQKLGGKKRKKTRRRKSKKSRKSKK